MIHELRSYRLRPGAAPAYLGLLAREGLPHVTRHLPLLGYWLTETGRLNTLHHLWAYADWAERTAARAALSEETAWTEGFIPTAFQWVEAQENLFLQLNRSSPEMEAALAARRREHAARGAEAPLLSADVAALTWSETGVLNPLTAEWQVVSGAEPHRSLSLHPRAAEPETAVPGALRHEIIRPLAFSPL